ncbi:hypothetical protein K9B35_19570 [Sphingomonas sp. R647]|uniref:DUF6894 family protein n=1 Tax=Sphingomonas sp. R647 TaxID=2875233 RepID=UPI001CD27670|nr:hypothetical protein [Sphingomonas sp. R647]MCA1200173.1 hypothetical protein [Sphingomonas sp. R647]
MTTYNINVRTDSHIGDTTRIEADDLTQLRVKMARFVGELLREYAELIWADQDWQVDVTNDRGLILYVISVSAMESAATSGKRL